MARPKQCRRVGVVPESNYYKPRGIPLSMLEEVVLSIDEFEAIRLADLGGLYQEQAAAKMNVSRPTFGRIIAAAHRKVAEALIMGKALKIEGGAFEMASMRKFMCQDCRHRWELPYGTGRPNGCPSCKSNKIHRAGEEGGKGRKDANGIGRCCQGNQPKQESEKDASTALAKGPNLPQYAE
jgi:uncharacterized protein